MTVTISEETFERVRAILRWEAFRVYPIKGPVPNAEMVLYELEQQASQEEPL